MDQLETQVSEIRSFLGPAPPAAGAASDRSDAAAVYSPVNHPGPLRRQASHPSLRGTPGDNSALAHSHPHLHHAQSPQIASSPGFPGISSISGIPGPRSANGSISGSVASGAKRRAADDDDVDDADAAAKQQRSKRNRYISIACNECKRRKIKCNGQTPCQRCGHLNLQCLYAPNCCSNSFKDSDEFKQVTDQVAQLQEQVDLLLENMTALRQEALRLAPIQDRILPPPSNSANVTPSPSAASTAPSLPRPLPPFRVPSSFNGPTSIAFTVDVAKNTLHKMGYSGLGDPADDGGLHPEPTPQTSPLLQPVPLRSPSQKPPDPLWEFDKDEMIRLCRLHEEEVGVMYPVVSIDEVIKHATSLSTWMQSAKRNGFVPPHGQDDGMSDPKTLMLKIVMCCGLTVEEHGNSAKAVRLYDTIQPIVDKTLMSEPASVAKLPFLALCAGYRFLSNDEILAWRMMGHVARLCLELGLHRREGLEQIADPQDRRNALYTFWSAYVLDRRWSFGTGLPFVCHDDKIDPKLPFPVSYSCVSVTVLVLTCLGRLPVSGGDGHLLQAWCQDLEAGRLFRASCHPGVAALRL
ncbi:hypothetical protein B0T25DRAFT_553710 [Lasiosphaeria hispida]|uniref:Zn(2)-C6 fungal-type domain-containing protein n=1 Tax=Lasiosphaeria hispida TaxID=260671 RepID=A0AAJ0MBA9_9PEZI|nr:hypothetical protein B0T25DRAFT_553710 [Lasiosphaeria hispida]